MPLSGDNRHAKLDDARLLRGDFRQGGAEVLRVLKIDIGDGAGYGRNDVRGVEAPAHAHLDQCQVHTLLREPAKGYGGIQFEKGGGMLKVRGRLLKEPDVFFHRGLINALAVDLEALAQVDQVGTGESSHAVTGVLQHGVQQRHHTSLAVCAGDVHSGIRTLWMLRHGEQLLNISQPQLNAVHR